MGREERRRSMFLLSPDIDHEEGRGGEKRIKGKKGGGRGKS